MLPIRDDNIIKNFVEGFLQKELNKNSWDFKTGEEKVELYFILLFLPVLVAFKEFDHFSKETAPKIKRAVDRFLLKLFMFGFLLLGICCVYEAFLWSLKEFFRFF